MQITKRPALPRALAALLLLAAAQATAADAGSAASVASVDACMRANIPQALQIKQFSLNSVDRNGGSRLLKGRLFAYREKGLLRTMLRVDEPADLHGAAYLLREGNTADQQDAMYVFLPALNRTRRIMGGSQDNKLFGTDISYSDIKQISHAFSGGKVELEKIDKLDARDAYVLKLVPDAAQQSRFSLIRTWIDRESCVALRAEFVADGQVRKRYFASSKDLHKSGDHWFVSKATMEDLGDHTHTDLSIDGVTGSDELADRYFDPHTFYLGG